MMQKKFVRVLSMDAGPSGSERLKTKVLNVIPPPYG